MLSVEYLMLTLLGVLCVGMGSKYIGQTVDELGKEIPSAVKMVREQYHPMAKDKENHPIVVNNTNVVNVNVVP